MIKSCIRFILEKWRGKAISLHKTMFANLIVFNLKDALKFPIWIYQGTNLESIGKIKVNVPLHPGMIRFGQRKFFRNGKTVIINRGTMEFDGDCTILGGTTVNVLGHSIHFGKEVMIGENTKILVGPRIEIGDFTRIAFGTVIMSADFHHVINIANGVVKRSLAPITIGKYNWIGCNSTIKKGTVTPDYCIVSSNSLLLKDYSTESSYPFIAGMPGKIKGQGLRRVYSSKHSEELRALFEEKGMEEVTIQKEADDPDFSRYCGEEIKVHSN